MSDSAEGSSAWVVTPDAYLRKNPPCHAPGARRFSRYVAVRDGTRLAVDVHLPKDAPAGARFPTLALFTPYYRRFALTAGAADTVEAAPNTAQYRLFFVPHGYAVVVVDVRGSGASFGAREGFRSPKERQDCADIADWLVAQEWCDGNIGSTGISYVGAAADFLASTGHPAVKAVVPTFAVWDTWEDQFHPGGLLLTFLPQGYGEMMRALDGDDRARLKQYAYFADPHFAGPAPVDEDADGALLREALAQHAHNVDMVDLIHELAFRDSPLAYDEGVTSATLSPYAYHASYRKNVAVYGVSGWYDGCGYSNGAVKRHLSLEVTEKRMTLGPWDHGARTQVSPFRHGQTPEFRLLAEMLRFFDRHLKGRESGQDGEKPVHYFTMAEEAWKAAETWPPPSRERVLHCGARGTLADQPGAAGEDTYRADFSLGTGGSTRFERLAAVAVTAYYPDWHGRDARMPTWTSPPLDADTEVTGHPLAHLSVASTERDGAFHLYLEDVEPDGTCRYVTEGALRGLLRRTGEAPRFHQVVGPFHPCRREDAEPMQPGVRTELAVPLMPISWLFRKGHRIRLAFAAADRDHFSRVPYGRFPVLTFFRGEGGCRLVLPVVAR